MTPTRRSVLRTVGTASALALAGCQTGGPSDSGTDSAPPRAPTDSPTPEPTPSETPELPARRALPEAGDDWELIGIDRISATNLGGKAGFTGGYRDPEGTRFRVVALEMSEGYDAADKAERWACIGWDMAVAYEGFALAAGTGTEQRNYTPETPPNMDRTAIPGSADRSRELLTRSPLLSAERVDANEVACEE
ncbi:hypothetical protein [Halosimplex halophilum]|uniref:hypothetical protein n=1 Tax=Halosimplex halophilum TaxID=2559572 RepID=UPI00107F08BB|nr:hypothetical protein [Halosimplex halophilum]